MIKNTTIYSIFILLILVSALQFSSWGINDNVYPILRNILIGIIGVLFIFSYKNPTIYLKNIPTFKVHLIGLSFFSVILFVLYAFGCHVEFSPARDLTIALVMLMIGLNVTFTEIQFDKIIFLYIFFYTIAAVSLVFTYASGFLIYEQYFPIPKNQIAPAFGIACIMSLYFAFKKDKMVERLLYLLFFGILLASLLVIRGRAAIVSVLIAAIVFIFFYLHNRKYKIITIIIAVSLFPFIGQYLYDALFLNYDVTDIDSISTGRYERILEGLAYLQNYPLTGQLANPIYKGRTIHNYVLISLVTYGIIVSILLLCIYFRYIIEIFKAIKKNTFQKYEVGPLVMLIIFIVSLFEYTYPYAPGSAIFFPFFLMGQFLRINFLRKEALNLS